MHLKTRPTMRVRIAAIVAVVCQLALAVEIGRVATTPPAPRSTAITAAAPSESIVCVSSGTTRLDRHRTASRTLWRQPVVLPRIAFDIPRVDRRHAHADAPVVAGVVRLGPRFGRAPPLLS